MEPLQEDILNEIEARANAARPGPWKSYIEGRDHDSGSDFIMVPDGSSEMSALEFSGKVTEADQDFLANAREDMLALIAEVRRLKS